MAKKRKGRAVRVYSINEEKLEEALQAIEDMVKPLKEKLRGG